MEQTGGVTPHMTPINNTTISSHHPSSLFLPTGNQYYNFSEIGKFRFHVFRHGQDVLIHALLRIEMSCQRAGVRDLANIINFAVKCGILLRFLSVSVTVLNNSGSLTSNLYQSFADLESARPLHGVPKFNSAAC